MQFVTNDAIEQQPIGLDVSVTIACPCAFQRMIAMAFRKRPLLDQQREQGTQLAQVLAALLGLAHIASKRGRVNRRQHVRC